MSENEPRCEICGLVHAPLDASRRYFYATAPGSEAHASEVEWFAKHGVIPKGVRQIEAFCVAMLPDAAASWKP